MHGIDGLGAQRQGGDGLNATQDVDLIGPPRCIAATLIRGGSPSLGGVAAATRSTPATLAVSTIMCAEAVSG